MSPAPKSKSKEKATSTSNKLAKDQIPQKPTQKPGLSNGGGSGALVSAYNPLSGTFHALDSADPSTLLLNPVKFRSIDEPDDHSPTSHGDFDSASNHDSCSGESEDTVPKANGNGSGIAPIGSSRTDSVPGCDTEKREKIRQKNEKKHQRQRERRAQELHEKCSGYLMSRKLESLSQQLVAMGFSQEQATMALIQNEGRVEESVAWLFEGGEDSRQPEGSAPDLHCGVGLKIDITDELGKIVELEKRYKCTKQEVERAVVACEGDLVKADENLMAQKQEAADVAAASRPKTPPFVPSKPEEMAINVSTNQRLPVQTKLAVQAPLQQQKRMERDFNYARSQEPTKNLVQSLDRPPVNPANLDFRMKPQPSGAAEKRWPVGHGNSNSFPASSSHLPVSVPQLKPEPHFPVSGTVMKGGTGPVGAGQLHPLREPVVVMQRPQTINPGKQNHPSTSLGLGHPNGSIPGLVESKMYNRGLGQSIPGLGHASNNGSTNGSASMHQFANQSHLDIPVTTSWSNGSSLSSPSSLGLFTSWGASRPLNGMQQNEWGNSGGGGGGYTCDYTAIDWSLDLALLNSSSNSSIGSERLSNTWSTMFMGGPGNMVRRSSTVNINAGGGGPYMSGLHEGNGNEARFNEWTSPFSGDDILGASRKFVMSPPCRSGDSFLE